MKPCVIYYIGIVGNLLVKLKDLKLDFRWAVLILSPTITTKLVKVNTMRECSIELSSVCAFELKNL